jgi:hypothetical protein
MKYEKPRVVALLAADAIQASNKESDVIQDQPTYLTHGAYEADE